MAVGIATKTVGDGNGGTITTAFNSSDGTAAGSLNPAMTLVDKNLAYLDLSPGQKTSAASSSVVPASDATFVLATVGYSAAVSLPRTADANAYAIGDVLGAATSSTAALSFTAMGPAAGRIMITSASLEIDVSAVPSGMTSFRLYLYSVTPPSALGDNAAWDLPSGDRASYLGCVDLGTPVDLGSTLYVETNGINKQVKLAGTGLYGYLVTNTSYTPTSGAVHVVTLHAVGL